jgi:phosphopantetheinyl transferase (holo-ACP synthase)
MPKHLFSEYDRYLPNDAIYLARLINLERFANLVSQLAETSKKPVKEVMATIFANKEAVLKTYSFIEPAFSEIEKDYQQ